MTLNISLLCTQTVTKALLSVHWPLNGTCHVSEILTKPVNYHSEIKSVMVNLLRLSYATRKTKIKLP